MLMDRIIKALTFKRDVYAEVEHDTSFTGTAWTLVAVIAFLSSLGSSALAETTTGWIVGSLVGTVITVIGFAVGAWVIAWLGKAMFQAEVSFDEMVRTLGLAYVWNGVGVLGVLGAFVPFLTCVTTPIVCLAALMGLASWFVATQEALDLDTGSTLITVIIGWVVTFLITAGAGFVLGLLGFAGGSILSGFTG